MHSPRVETAVSTRRRRRVASIPILLLGLAASAALTACGSGEARLKLGEGDGGSVTDTPGDADGQADTASPGDLTGDTSGIEPVPLPSGWSTSPPAARTDAQVCKAWLDSQPTAPVPFAPVDGCDPGTLSPEARADAMRRINFYRWLVGAELATEATGYLASLQACAFYQGSNALPISHEPPDSFPCHTAAASEVAAISNLAGGVATVAEAIDLFTTDTAHRTLLLAPGLLGSAVGFYEGVACQLVFGDNWTWEAPFHRTLAFPAPGPNPQPPTTLFTLLPATGHTYSEAIAATVTVGGQAVAATVQRSQTGDGGDVLEIWLPQPPPAQTPVTVSVTGIETSAGPVDESFTLRFISCE